MLKVEIEDKVWQKECKLCPVSNLKHIYTPFDLREYVGMINNEFIVLHYYQFQLQYNH